MSLLNFSHLTAQVSVNSGGISVSGPGGSLSVSLGQVDYALSQGSEGDLLSGVQQPFEISIITDLEDDMVDFHINVFPNPFQQGVSLELNTENAQSYRWQIFSIKGDLMLEGQGYEKLSYIDLSELNASLYLLRIAIEDRQARSFRIVKL